MLKNNSQINKFKKIIEKDYPKFKIESIKSLKSGWCNFVVEINKKYIFRFPKEKNDELKTEIKVLKYLNNKITLEIPNYEYLGKDELYVGYKKIIGQPLTLALLNTLNPQVKDKLAFAMANFLYEFHSLMPITKAKYFKLTSNHHEWRSEVISKYVIGKLSDKKLSLFIENSLNKYLELIKDTGHQVIAYNDLHQNNIAFCKKTNSLKGIFDFGDVAIEDISMEFYRLFYFDYKLAIKVINQYEKISGLKINIERVYFNSVICISAMLGVYNRKPNSKKYKDTWNDLLKLKKLAAKFI